MDIGNPFVFTYGQGERTLYHRNSDADLGVLRQIFEQEDYSLLHLARGAELFQTIAGSEKPLIIDAGAHIGASVNWFCATFPRAHIVAFEPDEGNFALLRKNTQGLNVELHHSAIGSNAGRVTLTDPGTGEWGYRTQDSADGTVGRESMTRIVAAKRAQGFTPFLAKVDIEGAEAELFSTDVDWIDQFPLIIVELHDWLLPKAGTSHNFIRSVAGRDRDFVHIGENIFSIRN